MELRWDLNEFNINIMISDLVEKTSPFGHIFKHNFSDMDNSYLDNSDMDNDYMNEGFLDNWAI